MYIFIFSTNPCPNYLKSRGACISLLLFFLLYREASYGHGPRGMMSGAPWFLPHPNHFLDFFIWMLLTASSIAFMWDIVSAFWSNLFIISSKWITNELNLIRFVNLLNILICQIVYSSIDLQAIWWIYYICSCSIIIISICNFIQYTIELPLGVG